MQLLKAAAGAALLGVSLSVAPLQAKVLGLVVGIDKYQHLPPLAGAVNDANDIYQSLQKISGAQISLLLDEQANFRNIRQQWFSMLRDSEPGDTLVFSYAGHGSRVPEQVKGSEADGQDDVFVLSGFDSGAAGQREMIRDNLLFEWFSAARDKDVQVLFVADSCHSGTMTRAADQRVTAARTRQVNIDFEQGLEEELTVALTPASAHLTREDLPYLTFLSAGLETQQIPEVFIKSIDGRFDTRGALSFVTARALEGEADSDLDGVLTRNELRHYVLENVSVLSERQQTPELSPLAQPQTQVLALSNRSVTAPVVNTDNQIKIFATGLQPALQLELASSIAGLKWVTTANKAQMIFDAKRGELLSAAGDLLASGLNSADKELLQARLRGAIDKRAAMRALHEAARRKLLVTSLLPDAGSHGLGSRIKPAFSGQHGEYLIVLNFAGDGTLQLLYPLASYGDPLRYGRRTWSVPLEVAAPLGEDHMIALAFSQAQPELLSALEKLDGTRAPLRVIAMLTAQLERGAIEVGIVGMFSREALPAVD